jgi:AcrR family transcriptional regulator
MARTVKEEEYAVKRKEILDMAQRLVYTKGYEQMSIQDILNELKISKGAFYHYFDSKQALLEALIERRQEEATQLLLPILQDPQLTALEKIQRYFDAAAHWKTARKDFFLGLLRGWYADNNAIVRHKVFAAGVKQIAPLLTVVICQGVQEGTLTTSYPDQVSEVILSLFQGLGDSLSDAILSYEPSHDSFQHVEKTMAAYTDALERVLGVPSNSLQLVDMATLREWFVSPNGGA